MPFRFKKKLMTRFIREFNYFILDRRTITRPYSFDLTGIERGFLYVVTYRLMNFLVRISDKACNLRLLNTLSRKGEGNRTLVGGLWLEYIPINGASIEARRRSCFQTPDRKS